MDEFKFDPILFVCPGCGGRWRKKITEHLTWRVIKTGYGIGFCSQVVGANQLPIPEKTKGSE